MTKKELADTVEKLAAKLVTRYGAKLVEKEQKVGGNTVTVTKAVGGVFDLDAARGIVASQLERHADVLSTMPGLPGVTPPAETA